MVRTKATKDNTKGKKTKNRDSMVVVACGDVPTYVIFGLVWCIRILMKCITEGGALKVGGIDFVPERVDSQGYIDH